MSKITTLLLIGVLAGCSGKAEPAGPAPGTMAYDQHVFTTLLDEHTKITRTVRDIEGGIESVTESDDPRLAELLYDHTMAMKRRLHDGSRIRQVDPLFVAIFDHHDQITMEVERTPKGVRAREYSSNPKVAKLIRAHAEMVNGFVREGMTEFMRKHPVPEGAAGSAP